MQYDQLRIGVADAVLIRQALTFYEERLMQADRDPESTEVTLAVVQTVENLGRLQRRLLVWIRQVDLGISGAMAGVEDADDIPF